MGQAIETFFAERHGEKIEVVPLDALPGRVVHVLRTFPRRAWRYIIPLVAQHEHAQVGAILCEAMDALARITTESMQGALSMKETDFQTLQGAGQILRDKLRDLAAGIAEAARKVRNLRDHAEMMNELVTILDKLPKGFRSANRLTRLVPRYLRRAGGEKFQPNTSPPPVPPAGAAPPGPDVPNATDEADDIEEVASLEEAAEETTDREGGDAA